jgi:hypothetical protein
MTGILEKEGTFRVQSLAKPRVLSALGVLAALAYGFAKALIYLHEEGLHHIPIYFFPLFPCFFLLTFLLAFPMIVYISYERDFEHLHPLNPKDFMRLVKRTFQAVNNSGRYKVSSKHL